MANFTGALGGCLMIALIILLFYKFLEDLGVNYIKENGKSIACYFGGALVFGLLYLLAGFIIFSVQNDGSGVALFDVFSIWNIQPVSDTMGLVSDYSGDAFSMQGYLPLYYLLSKCFGNILFEMYQECAFYISFLSGIITCVSWGLFLKKYSDNEKATDVFIMLLCVPGSIMLFLPCSFSFYMALFSVFLLFLHSDKKVVAGIFAIMCCLTHIFGIVPIVMLIATYIGKTKGVESLLRNGIVMVAGQVVLCGICIAIGWGSLAEYMVPCALGVLLLYCGKTDKRLSYGATSMINLSLVLVSGYYIVGKLMSVF
ncbi:MAG: hypothetical protein E7265_08975 [Lachnospiraceae bacterium]|nr:hypothetical protein [Lachnospiraceae bacterium]